MPFKSAKQRAFMFATHPNIAKKWTAKYGAQPQPKPPTELDGYLDTEMKKMKAAPKVKY